MDEPTKPPTPDTSIEAKARRTQIIIVVAMAVFMLLPFALIALMQWLGR